MALFTPEELEELRKADAELDEEFVQTQEEINASRKRDKEVKFSRKDEKGRKVAERKRAYYEANKEKAADYQRAYREANKEKVAERNRAYREANREKYNAYMRKYYAARKAAQA